MAQGVFATKYSALLKEKGKKMKRCFLTLVMGVALIGQVNLVQGSQVEVFSDNFNGSGLDTSKWSTILDIGCDLQVSGGVLHNYFTGRDWPGSSYARSIDIQLPANWEEVTITGQWSYPVRVYGEMLMKVEDADASGNYDIVAYYNWGGPAFRAQDTGGAFLYTSRSIPTTLTDFEWVITPDGWQFKECRDGSWSVLVDRDTTNFAGMDEMVLQIGGWEFSYTPIQQTDYDNIVVSATVVPEPVTLVLVGMGIGFVGRLRPRRTI
jgi:hypothetical protein